MKSNIINQLPISYVHSTIGSTYFYYFKIRMLYEKLYIVKFYNFKL